MISLGEFRIKCDVHFAFKTGQQSENRFFFYISFTYEVAKRKCLTVTGDELKIITSANILQTETWKQTVPSSPTTTKGQLQQKKM